MGGLRVTGAVIATVGALVMAGWWLDLPALVSLRPGWAAMMFNTALCFVLVGVAVLLLLRDGLHRFAVLPATAAGFIGLVTGLQAVFGFDAGIDALFHAGSLQMAPNTAMCFALAGAALGLYAIFHGEAWADELLWSAGMLVMFVGALSLVAYMAGFGAYTGWSAFTPMALHTALLFVLVGVVALVLAPWRMDRSSLGMLVPLAVLVVGLNLWQMLEAGERRQLQVGAERQVEHTVAGIHWSLRTKTMLVDRLAERIGERGRLPTQAEWEVEASGILRDFAGLGGFGVIDRDGYMVTVVSQAGIGEQLGAHMSVSESVFELFERTRQTGQQQVSSTAALRTGGDGLFIASPILIDGEFAGITLASINYAQFFGASLAHISPGYALSINEGGTTLYARTHDAPGIEDDADASADIVLPGATWHVHAWPGETRAGEVMTPLPRLMALAGVLTAILLMAAMRSAERVRRAAHRQSLLSDVSREVVSMHSLHEALQRLTDSAREVVGAHQGLIRLSSPNEAGKLVDAISLSDKYAKWRDYDVAPDGSGIYAQVWETNRSLRLAHSDLLAQPRWRGFGAHAKSHPPIRGLLAVPLIAKDGKNLGVVMLSDRFEGDFTENDERILVQIAALSSAVIQNARLIDNLEQKVAERTRDLKQLNAELESFNYSVSHDLRTPLRAISGFGEILSKDYAHALDDEGRHLLERIMDGTVRMGRLIDDLLALARVSRADMVREEVDLARIAGQVISQHHEADPGRDVAWIAPDTMPATGDPRLLAVVLDNLIGNAWKFTSKRDDARIEMGVEGGAWFVRDNGVGFDMRHADQLFGLFQRLHHQNEFPGTGVGLATVRRIVERHGGRIWCEAAPGDGACFRFTLDGGSA